MKIIKKQHIIIAIFGIFILFISCNKYKNAEIKEQFLPDEIPDYFVGNADEFNAQVHLGRVLFYDKNLSLNNTVSCASCHKQEFAFADNVAFSSGFENRQTKRNSIAIQNLITANFFGEQPLFWDGRETSLNSLISKPIANHIEMGMDDDAQLLQKLNALPYIQNLVKKAFGETATLDMDKLSNSMSRFLELINTRNSKFDLSQNPTTGIKLNALESKGSILFNTTYQCNNCHNAQPGAYNSFGFFNIGLDVDNPDKGRMNVTNSPDDEGAIKAPDLHNVAITAPYMHDGRFKTLDDVLEHYSQGIQDNNNLSFMLKDINGSPKKLNITSEDKKALIAFLNSTTDYTMLNNPLISNPFKYK